VWDEVTIEMHDAERGTRQKISEPKTPYHHHSWDSGELTGSEEDSTNKSQNSDEHSISHDKSVLNDPESFDMLHSKVEQQAQLQQEGHKLVKSPRVIIATDSLTKRKNVEFSSSDEEPPRPCTILFPSFDQHFLNTHTHTLCLFYTCLTFLLIWFISFNSSPSLLAHEEFVKKRKEHYDEFRRLKELRAKGLKEDDDNDDDDDDDDSM
jgi:hypothetical protein